MIRRYHVWWAIEDVFQGAKSFVKQLSLIAVENSGDAILLENPV